jgi:hypothetical protein
MVHRRFILAGGLAVLSTGLARAQTPTPEQALAPAGKRPSFRLEEAARFDHQATGVAVSAEGRVFVNFPRWTEDSRRRGGARRHAETLSRRGVEFMAQRRWPCALAP